MRYKIVEKYPQSFVGSDLNMYRKQTIKAERLQIVNSGRGCP